MIVPNTGPEFGLEFEACTVASTLSRTIANQTLDLDLTAAGGKPRTSLAELCTNLLLIVVRMREAEDLGEPEALRALIRHFLDRLDSNARATGASSERIALARYAVVALMDETVLSMPGPCRDSWLSNPMQLEYFGDNLAGEEFYRKLDALMAAADVDREVLEVYLLCLSLGFSGKYLMGSAGEREQLISRVAARFPDGGRERLSPHAFRQSARRGSRPAVWRRAALWIAGAGTAGLVVAAWVTARLLTVAHANSILVP